MLRFKIIGTLSALMALLAISASPASAEFQSTQKQGNGRVITSGEFKISTVGVTTCVASEIKGQWHIQTKGQIKGQQTEATKGPRLLIQVKEWGKCETKISGGAGQATEITPCNLELVQRSTTVASGGVASTCVLKISTLCTVQIPAGMETAAGSDQGINVGLLETKLATGLNSIAKVNVTKGGTGGAAGEGVYYNASGINCVLPKPADEKAELVGMEIEGEGLEVV